MGVVFDEVTGEVEAPLQEPQAEEQRPGEERRQPSPGQTWQWLQQQATVQRRQLRVEAD
jgi:hypothetical protein